MALSFAGHGILHTGQQLLSWSCEGDASLKSFAESAFAKSNELLLPYYGMDVGRAKESANGCKFTTTDCALLQVVSVPEVGVPDKKRALV